MSGSGRKRWEFMEFRAGEEGMWGKMGEVVLGAAQHFSVLCLRSRAALVLCRVASVWSLLSPFLKPNMSPVKYLKVVAHRGLSASGKQS